LRTGMRSGRPKSSPVIRFAGSIKRFATRIPDNLNFLLLSGPGRWSSRWSSKSLESSWAKLRSAGFCINSVLVVKNHCIALISVILHLLSNGKRKFFPKYKSGPKKKVPLSTLRMSPVCGRIFMQVLPALKGQTPVVETTGARFGLNMMAAITPRGEMHFMIVHGSVNSDKTWEFLKRLMHDSEKKVFLIWDGHPTHKAKKVKECIESFEGRLEIFVLPSYSPDLNPTEQLWNHTKTYGVGRQSLSGPDELKKAVIGKLRRLQKLPAKIVSFFRHTDRRYLLVS